jgi:hypothetical protein
MFMYRAPSFIHDGHQERRPSTCLFAPKPKSRHLKFMAKPRGRQSELEETSHQSWSGQGLASIECKPFCPLPICHATVPVGPESPTGFPLQFNV